VLTENCAAYRASIEHLNGNGRTGGHCLQTFSSKALVKEPIMGKKVQFLPVIHRTKSDAPWRIGAVDDPEQTAQS